METGVPLQNGKVAATAAISRHGGSWRQGIRDAVIDEAELVSIHAVTSTGDRTAGALTVMASFKLERRRCRATTLLTGC
jgi:hypothetical protein